MQALANLIIEAGLLALLAAWAVVIYQRRLMPPLGTGLLMILTLWTLYLALSDVMHTSTRILAAILILAFLAMLAATVIIARLSPRPDRSKELREGYRDAISAQRKRP